MQGDNLLGIATFINFIIITWSSTPTLPIQEECYDELQLVHRVNEDRSYIVKWAEGVVLSSVYCSVLFTPIGDESKDDYEICFEPVEYSVSDCEVHVDFIDSTYVRDVDVQTMKYDVDYIEYYKTYSCKGIPERWCAEENDDAKLVVSGGYNARLSSFKIKVTAVKTFNYRKVVGGIVGGVLGGLVLIAIVIIVVKCRSRRKRAKGAKSSTPESIDVANQKSRDSITHPVMTNLTTKTENGSSSCSMPDKEPTNRSREGSSNSFQNTINAKSNLRQVTNITMSYIPQSQRTPKHQTSRTRTSSQTSRTRTPSQTSRTRTPSQTSMDSAQKHIPGKQTPKRRSSSSTHCYDQSVSLSQEICPSEKTHTENDFPSRQDKSYSIETSKSVFEEQVSPQKSVSQQGSPKRSLNEDIPKEAIPLKTTPVFNNQTVQPSSINSESSIDFGTIV